MTVPSMEELLRLADDGDPNATIALIFRLMKTTSLKEFSDKELAAELYRRIASQKEASESTVDSRNDQDVVSSVLPHKNADTDDSGPNSVDSSSIPYMHIFGQGSPHDDIIIVGNDIAFNILATAIQSEDFYCSTFAGDGEGYGIHLCRLNSDKDWQWRMELPYTSEVFRVPDTPDTIKVHNLICKHPLTPPLLLEAQRLFNKLSPDAQKKLLHAYGVQSLSHIQIARYRRVLNDINNYLSDPKED